MKDILMVPQIRNITIHSVMNGYIAKVGCKQFVFTSMEFLLRELRAYLEQGGDYEKEILGGVSLEVAEQNAPIRRNCYPVPEQTSAAKNCEIESPCCIERDFS